MRILSLFLCVLLSISFISGCTQKTASSSEAIDAAKTIQDVQEKANYLIGQAKAFYNSKEFQDAVNILQYVLTYVDKDSTQAKDLLEKAKLELINAAKGAVDDAKKKFGF